MQIIILLDSFLTLSYTNRMEENNTQDQQMLVPDYDIYYVGPWRAKQYNLGVVLERSLNQLQELLDLEKELHEDI
jgi:hypothetical protein